MKFVCEIACDTATGQYSLRFFDPSQPSKTMQFSEIAPYLQRVIDHNTPESAQSLLDSQLQLGLESAAVSRWNLN